MDPRGEQGFEEFARAVMTDLERVGYALTHDAAEAQDLVQATLERIFVAWGNREIRNPTGYARATLSRLFIDDRRRARHSRELLTTHVPEPQGETSGDAQVVNRVAIRSALVHLAPRQRIVLVLRYIEDLSVAAVAEELRISQGTVKRCTYDGLRALRALLNDPHLAEVD